MNACQLVSLCDGNAQLLTMIVLTVIFFVGLMICEQWDCVKFAQGVSVVLAMLFAATIYLIINTPPEQMKPSYKSTYSRHWQQQQDAKLVACYQSMATQAEVNYCLLKLDVFI